MKVFEVITEFCEGDSKKVTQQREYVTSKDNSLVTVATYFEKHCEQYEKDLISVREVLTIVQKIGLE